jgi:hypothetical protein
VPVLAKIKTVTGRLWTYVRDDRPFGGTAAPAAVFFYSRDRSGEHAARHLASYAGILQADAYSGFGQLYNARQSPGPITEAACWAHSRRKFFELADVTKAAAAAAAAGARAEKKAANLSPLALDAVRRIDVIFEIERSLNGLPADRRLELRTLHVAPLVTALEGWMRNGARRMDADRAGPALAAQSCRQGDRLHADPLARLHPVP